MTIGLIVGAIAGAAVGGILGVMWGGLAKTEYDPVKSARKIFRR